MNIIKKTTLIFTMLLIVGCSSMRQTRIDNNVNVKEDKTIMIEIGKSTMTDMVIKKLLDRGYTITEPSNKSDLKTRFVLKDNVKWNENILLPNRHWGSMTIVDNYENKAIATVTVNNKWKWRATNKLVKQFDKNTSSN